MTEFQEDMIFKNVSEEDASILLGIVGKKSKHVHIWTKELRQLDPKSYKPDLIIELDDENLIIEFQSTKIDDDFSKRGLTYVAMTNRNKKNKKEVNLLVLSTVEDSKIVEYKYNKLNTFKYEVEALSNIDSEKIIKNAETKLKNKKELTSHDVILLSLVPLSRKTEDIYTLIKKANKLLNKFNHITRSQNDIACGIMWLTTAKFVKNPLERNLICDLLGDRMSLIFEYGENKYNEGIEKIIINLLKSGDTPENIAQKAKISYQKVIKIKKENNL